MIKHSLKIERNGKVGSVQDELLASRVKAIALGVILCPRPVRCTKENYPFTMSKVVVLLEKSDSGLEHSSDFDYNLIVATEECLRSWLHVKREIERHLI